jgi:hypothetical protein
MPYADLSRRSPVSPTFAKNEERNKFSVHPSAQASDAAATASATESATANVSSVAMGVLRKTKSAF